MRTSPGYRTDWEGESVRTALAWCDEHAPHWAERGALLLARADLFFKVDVPLRPPPDANGTLAMPFRLIEESGKGACVIGYSDAVVYVPRWGQALLERYLGHRSQNSLHSLSTWFRSTAVWLPTANADADSSAHWNPLYYMIGRPKANASAPRPCCGSVVEKG